MPIDVHRYQDQRVFLGPHREAIASPCATAGFELCGCEMKFDLSASAILVITLVESAVTLCVWPKGRIDSHHTKALEYIVSLDIFT